MYSSMAIEDDGLYDRDPNDYMRIAAMWRKMMGTQLPQTQKPCWTYFTGTTGASRSYSDDRYDGYGKVDRGREVGALNISENLKSITPFYHHHLACLVDLFGMPM